MHAKEAAQREARIEQKLNREEALGVSGSKSGRSMTVMRVQKSGRLYSLSQDSIKAGKLAARMLDRLEKAT